MTYNLNKTYGNEIPPEFQFLQGGTFINLLPKALEENLVEYYQYFTTETNQEILTKKANQILIQLHTNYLNETGWIWQKYQRNVVILKEYELNHPVMQQFATVLGISEEETKAIFEAASKLA